MKIEHCLRCQSTNLQKGVIYEYTHYHVNPMSFQFEGQPSLLPDSVPLSAIICKTCGHVELFAETSQLIEPTRYACPHCKAKYYYHVYEDADSNTVKCQNCGKNFQIDVSKKSTDVLDAIEEDLREE